MLDERSGSEVVLDLGLKGPLLSLRFTGGTVLCLLARHFILCLILVQPRWTGKCLNMQLKNC